MLLSQLEYCYSTGAIITLQSSHRTRSHTIIAFYVHIYYHTAKVILNGMKVEENSDSIVFYSTN